MFIIGKYAKIRFKNRGSPCYFLSSRDEKIKNITKIEQKRLFFFTFLVSFLMAFLAQKLIYAITTWFNFVFGSFYEKDHLLSLFILGVYAKRWPKCAYFHAKTDVAQNLIDDFFLTCQRTSVYKGFWVKKNMGVRG